MYERKALDLILDSAEYEDTLIGDKQTEAPAVSTVEMQAVPGTMEEPGGAAESSEAKQG